ncbi:MAG: ATP-dependent helicase [Sulfurifustis sp.]
MLDLSEPQKAAVQYVKGPLLILGGAGSGKTSVLAYKIAWLIRQYDTPAGKIALVVANARAARELRARVAGLLGRQLQALRVGTFSELAFALIERRLAALGLSVGFSLYDRRDCEDVVQRLLNETHPRFAHLAAAVAQQIGRWKESLNVPAADSFPETSAAHIAASVYPRFQERLQAANAIDVNDLVGRAVQLLDGDPAAVDEWQGETHFLLVDEYETTTVAEHALVQRLTGKRTQLTAAGDENCDSAPGADGLPGNIARLRAGVPGLRTVQLEQNFRSTTRIARAAAALINPDRVTAAPGRSDPAAGRRLQVIKARSEEHEAECIVRALLEHKRGERANFRDYAVLVSRAEQFALIERALQAYHVPHQRREGKCAFAHVEVRDLWSYLRLLCNPSDDVAFLRAVNTPRRTIDRATLGGLMRFAAERRRPLLACALDCDLAPPLTSVTGGATLQTTAALLRAYSERAIHGDPVLLAHDLIEDLRYDEWLRDTCNDVKIAAQRMQNVTDLIERLRRLAARLPNTDLRRLMSRLSLETVHESEGTEAASDAITLAPIAFAKGSEFAHVFIAGFEEGLLPGNTDVSIERRRGYTAISCARASVTFTITEHRRVAGEAAMRRPSRFLAEMPPDDIEWLDVADRRGAAESVVGRDTGTHQIGARQGGTG